MPNWNLTDTFRSDFKTEVNTMLERRISLFEQDFPVSAGVMTQAMVPQEVRAAMQVLTNYRVNTILRTTVLYAVVEAETLPGLERDVLLQCHVPNTFHLFDTQGSGYNAQQAFEQGRYDRLPFDVNLVDERLREKLVKWINTAVKERRRAAGVRQIVSQFITNHCDSLAELNARWPGLTVVVSRMRGGRTDWAARLRALPEKELARWGWPSNGKTSSWYTENMTRIEGCDIILSAASLQRTDAPTPAASVVKWGKS